MRRSQPMEGEQLYAAVVTSVPFLLLALIAETQVFGPAPQDRKRLQRLGAAVLDIVMLLALAVAFFSSLWGLAVDEPPDLRPWAAYGLAFGAVAAFTHTGGRVLRLYWAAGDESTSEESRRLAAQTRHAPSERPVAAPADEAPVLSRGTARGMTTPDAPTPHSLADTASESPEESIRHEREAVGDRPDTGGLVTPDHGQSAPAPDGA